MENHLMTKIAFVLKSFLPDDFMDFKIRLAPYMTFKTMRHDVDLLYD